MSSSGSTLRTTEGPRPPALIVGVQLPDVSDEAFQASLKELARLADTLGLTVVGQVTQRRGALAAAAVVGAGKLRQIAAYTGGPGFVPTYAPPGKRKEADPEQELAQARAEDALARERSEHDDDDDGFDPDAPGPSQQAELVLVDHDLTPSQMRNLEKATGADVLDRSMVILSIFQRHARTREARMQVEIARLNYMAPRMREASAGQDRQRGGIGGRGAGESALELDRRRVRDRIAELRRELENVKREADTRRSRRTQTDSHTVALVGYTNAGKSSLMRALTGDEVYVADQLFATLDTTVRALKPETRPRILVSDTVGFIKKLPHDLVASFRSTLEEARDASLLLHLVDGSDPAFRDQYQVTREVLAEIAAGDNASLLVLNKSDKLDEATRKALEAEFPQALMLSAKDPEDVRRLHERIVAHFEQSMGEQEFLIPYSEQRFVAMLHERCRVLEENYEDEGTRIRVRAPAAVLAGIASEFGAR
ncbi:MAG: GTPase HflX [Myxococcales bacterium]